MSFGIKSLLRSFSVLQSKLDSFIEREETKFSAKTAEIKEVEADITIAHKLKFKVDDLLS